MLEAYVAKTGAVCCGNDRCRQRFASLITVSKFDGSEHWYHTGLVHVLPGWVRGPDGVYRMTNARRKAADRKQPWLQRRQPSYNVREVDEAGRVVREGADPTRRVDGGLVHLPVRFHCRCGTINLVDRASIERQLASRRGGE